MTESTRGARTKGQGETVAKRPTEADASRKSTTTTVHPRAQRYLVAPLPAPLLPLSVPPIDPVTLFEQLEGDPQITVVRILRPQRRELTVAGSVFPPIAVVETTPDRAAMLAALPQVHVDADEPLGYGDRGLTVADPGSAPPADRVTVDFTVSDDTGQPVAGAFVHVLGDSVPAAGVTDDRGWATVSVSVEDLAHPRGVYVRPRSDSWSRWIDHPDLSTSAANPVVCERIGEGDQLTWASRAMGFDRLPPTYHARGVKIAILDSGAASTHSELTGRVAVGVDVVNHDDKSWQEDLIGTGTHAAALIGATNGSRITGPASEAELHVYKLMPGGRFSDLIEAVDQCLTGDVDVLNLGVGSARPSWLVALKLDEARRAGVACVAAATGFPARIPGVLAVGAVGRLDTYPPDSYHATQVGGPPTAEGFYLPRFADGQTVDVYAPGVAVVAAVPPTGLAALDGTASAAPLVSALAALILAHHPDFRNFYRARNAARVDHLFALITDSVTPAGIPNAAVALGL